MGEFDNIATPDDTLKLAAQRTGLTALDPPTGTTVISYLLDQDPSSTPRWRRRKKAPPSRSSACTKNRFRSSSSTS